MPILPRIPMLPSSATNALGAAGYLLQVGRGVCLPVAPTRCDYAAAPWPRQVGAGLRPTRYGSWSCSPLWPAAARPRWVVAVG